MGVPTADRRARLVVLVSVFVLLLGISAFVPQRAEAAVANEYVGISPVRAADTRTGVGVRAGVVGAGATLQVKVAGKYAVPANARAVSMNVTVTQPRGSGYVTVFPCGQSRPTASNVNFTSAQTVPNAVVSGFGSGGLVCVFSSVATHLVVDVNGYFPTGSNYTPIRPVRAEDTRAVHLLFGKLHSGSPHGVTVVGKGGVPKGAYAAVLNITVTGPASAGYLSVYPCGIQRPATSSLNFAAGQTIANMVVGELDAAGRICVFSTARTHVVVDVQGYFKEGTAFSAMTPERLVDTRTPRWGPALFGGETVALSVADGGELAAVSLNVTVTKASSAGYITVFPCDQRRPTASSLNFVKGQTVPNAVIAKVDSNGEVCFYASAGTHLIVDINGTFVDPDNHPVLLAAGLVHTCALKASGSIVCWGSDAYGALGDGATLGANGLAAVLGIDDAVSVSSGARQSCAVLEDGSVKCWGLGPVGDGTTAQRESPARVKNLGNVVDVAIGEGHSCALLENSTVRCWGHNGGGQLGDGTFTDRMVPVPVSGLADVVAIEAAGAVTCAVLADGAVKCWGYNDGGFLGAAAERLATPTTIAGLADVVWVSIGPDYGCALIVDGSVDCWGSNTKGQLGDGTTTSRTAPAPVPGISTAVTIDTNMGTSCATLENGSALCWGGTPWQEAGVTVPRKVPGLPAAADVQVGANHFAALTRSLDVFTWGDGVSGQLGDGNWNPRNTPGIVPGL